MNSFQKNFLLTSLGMVTLGWAAPSTAQDKEIYENTYFESYAPRTAQDMIFRIPGFQLRNGDTRRGLGQGGTNVLLNGERLSGKSDDGGQLNRITSNNVMRIEILDGATLDIPGLTGRVANIVTKNSGVSGSWVWTPQFRQKVGANFGTAQLTVSGEKGNLGYSLELRNRQHRGSSWGPELLTQADGVIFERRDERTDALSETPGVVLDLTWKPKDEHFGNLNFEFNQYNYNLSDTSRRTAVTARGETKDTQFSSAEDEWNVNVGGDYELPFANGRLKTIGYYRAEHSPTIDRFDVFEPGLGLTSGSRFFRKADEGETIARTEYSWKSQNEYDWQLGLEGAYNFLDIESELLEYDGTDYVDAPLDGATSKVEEKRAEVTLTHSRPVSSQWDLQASLGAEYSELSQTGGLRRNFFRPKGFLAATYKPYDGLAIRSKFEREVGQLNFFDFLAAPSFQDDLNSASNINLVPSQSWNGEIEFDRDYGQGNTLKVRFYGELISDIVDRIPIGANGDAVGNIDSATRYGVDTDLTLKGERWGLNGIEVAMLANFQGSNVDDPLTQFSRRLNDEVKIFTNFRLRHDIENTDWAYGFYAGRLRRSSVHRLNTIGQYVLTPGWGEVFVEHKDIFGMKVVATVENLFNATENYSLDVFTDRRDVGVLDYTEARIRYFKPRLLVEFSGQF